MCINLSTTLECHPASYKTPEMRHLEITSRKQAIKGLKKKKIAPVEEILLRNQYFSIFLAFLQELDVSSVACTSCSRRPLYQYLPMF